MILPQLEGGNHGVEVVGMMFFDDNVYSLSADNEIGMRLSKIAEQQNNSLNDLRSMCASQRLGRRRFLPMRFW